MASFDSEDLHSRGAASRPFDSDGYLGFDPRLPSQRFERFPDDEDDQDVSSKYSPPQRDGEEEEEYEREIGHGDPSAFRRRNANDGEDEEDDEDEEEEEVPPPYRSPFDEDLSTAGGDSPSPFDSRFQSELSPPPHGFARDSNGQGYVADDDIGHGVVGSAPPAPSAFPYPPTSAYPGGSLNGSVLLPPPEEMEAEEGFILREWKRKNAIHLEEKFRKEREKLAQIIDAADAFKVEFYEKRRRNYEANKISNRDKEKVFVENLTQFHATADKHYWKAVAELVPHELPSIEGKSRGKDKKKPSVVINHGPKPGKTTDLSRMRQVLTKLKHNPPAHMKAPPPPSPSPSPPAPAPKDGNETKPAVPQTQSTVDPPSQAVPVSAST